MTTMLQGLPITPSTPVNPMNSDEPDRFDLEQAIRESLATCDYSHKAAAYTMDMEPSQFSRELHDGHVRLDRILMLPRQVQRALVERWALFLGLQVISTDLKRENVRRLLRACADVLAAHEGM